MFASEICYIFYIVNASQSIPREEKILFHSLSRECQELHHSGNVIPLPTNVPAGYCPIGHILYNRCVKLHSVINTDYSVHECGISLSERIPFWTNSWKNLAPPLYGETHAQSLLNVLEQKMFSSFSFIGDSVSSQIANAILQLQKFRGNLQNSTVSIKEYTYLPCGLLKIGVTARDPQHCFTTSKKLCTDRAQAEYLVNRTLNVGKKSVTVLHPFGAHIWNNKNDLDVARGIALGIIDAAKLAISKGSLILILESPAQHFVYDIAQNFSAVNDEGNYTGDFLPSNQFYRKNVAGPCCRATIRSDDGNYRNIKLKHELDEIDIAWRSYVGWVSFYDISQIVHNGHADAGGDCTHFAWSPQWLEALWHFMQHEILRLAKNVIVIKNE
jgi:hypothetical protein